MKLADLPTRIAAKIEVQPNGCWLWTGAVGGGGYGYVKFDRKLWRVHRLVYTILVGPIPAGLTLDHVRTRGCSSTLCCWPDHLEPVTQAVNVLRGESVPARNARKVHCKRGHEFTPENTYSRARGQRECRTCLSERERARWARGRR